MTKRILLATCVLVTSLGASDQALCLGAGRDIGAVLDKAVVDAEARQDPLLKYCVKSFRSDLENAKRSAKGSGSATKPTATRFLWTVAEGSGGMSTTTRIETSTASHRIDVVLRSDDGVEHGHVRPDQAEKFDKAWLQTMEGPGREVSGIVDGSCTLVTDGDRVRIFAPGQGVVVGDGDALQRLMAMVEQSLR
jgi:hypothetical protein